MASNSPVKKRNLCDLVAYVTQISPAKKAKSARLKLQIGDNEVKRAVCFDMSKMETLRQKKVSCEPMKLQNVVIDKQSNPLFAEYIINTKTTITNPQPNEVAFPHNEPVLATLAINHIDLSKVGEVVSVRGLVTDRHRKLRVAEVFNRNSNISDNNFISDPTGTVSFTMWDQWIQYFDDEKEKGNTHFLLFNLLVKEFDSKLYLTTFSDTFVEIDSSPIDFDANIPPVIEDEEHVLLPSFDIVGKFRYSYLCLKCGKNINININSNIVKCKMCHAMQRSNNLEKSLDVEVGSGMLGVKMFTISYENISRIWPVVSGIVDLFDVDEAAITNVLLSAQDIAVIVNNETFQLNVWHV